MVSYLDLLLELPYQISFRRTFEFLEDVGHSWPYKEITMSRCCGTYSYFNLAFKETGTCGT